VTKVQSAESQTSILFFTNAATSKLQSISVLN